MRSRVLSGGSVGLCVAAAGLLLCAAGCGGGPTLGVVEGTVTLDGQPLANAEVEFSPDDSTKSSYFGKTDAAGHYRLYAGGDQKGAELGAYLVRITLADPGDDAGAQPPKQIPARYNSKSEEKREVKAGENKFDFPLTSE